MLAAAIGITRFDLGMGVDTIGFSLGFAADRALVMVATWFVVGFLAVSGIFLRRILGTAALS